ncbi:hypothetical protein ACQP2E_15780 [Actinoplanes sp. CA-015351]|uniref:hypothetical protein n=1 Tax=Actinoplanes sp. CA-015351 TaxID=3239897 RepID=UPI003D961A17
MTDSAIVLTDVDLVPRIELGADSGSTLPRRLSMGQPVFSAIAPASVDDGTPLGEYLRTEAGTSTYYLLDLVVNLRPDKNESFTELGVGVRLSTDGTARDQPIAWSLSPLRSTEPAPVKRTVGLTVKAVIIEPKVERQTEEARDVNFVVAYGQRESAFEWRYQPTAQRALDGALQMHAIVKAPAGVEVRADIVVAATLQLPGGFPKRRYRAELPAQLRTVRGSARPAAIERAPAGDSFT